MAHEKTFRVFDKNKQQVIESITCKTKGQANTMLLEKMGITLLEEKPVRKELQQEFGFVQKS